MRPALLLAVGLALLASCASAHSAPMSELEKVTTVKVGTPTLIFVHTDG